MSRINIILVGLSTAVSCIFSLAAHADPNTYVTGQGLTFTQVTIPGGFGKAWKTPDGLIWSALQGKFQNLPLKPESHSNYDDFSVGDTEASLACKKIGGTLPTRAQYRALLSFFSVFVQDGSRFRLARDENDFYKIFPDMLDLGDNLSDEIVRKFWTSEASGLAKGYGYVFQSDKWNRNEEELRSELHSVRCVVQGPIEPVLDPAKYETWRGAIFTRVTWPNGSGKAWKDPDGTIWSDDLGSFTNEALHPDQAIISPGYGDAEFRVIDTPATRACDKIGGKLPTLTEFERLRRFFYSGVEDKERAFQDFKKLFPRREIWPGEFDDTGWTSTVDGHVTVDGDPTMGGRVTATEYHPGRVDVMTLDPTLEYHIDIDRTLKSSVRCVTR